MVTRCDACLLRSQPFFQPLSSDELRETQALKVGEVTVDAGTPVLSEGLPSNQIFTVLSGVGVRSRSEAPRKRRVLSFVFPGDLLGLQDNVMDVMRHTIEARSRMRLCVFDRRTLWDFVQRAPQRSYSLIWSAARDSHFLGDAHDTQGQRTAEQSVAWALVKLWRRGSGLGMTQGTSMPMPFKQQDLADALGLSLVHTNKTLAKFRDKALAVWRDGRLIIDDLETLAAIGQATNSDTPPKALL